MGPVGVSSMVQLDGGGGVGLVGMVVRQREIVCELAGGVLMRVVRTAAGFSW